MIFMIIAFIIAILAWIAGVGFFFVISINGLRLVSYTRKHHPNIRVSFFVFVHKTDKEKLFYSKAPEAFFRVLITLGSKPSIEQFLKIFMDLDKLRKLNNKKINKYINNMTFAYSWAIRLMVLFLLLVLALSRL